MLKVNAGHMSWSLKLGINTALIWRKSYSGQMTRLRNPFARESHGMLQHPQPVAITELRTDTNWEQFGKNDNGTSWDLLSAYWALQKSD